MNKSIAIVLVSALASTIGLIPGIARAKLVACVGDSLTYGFDLSDRASNCYPAQLARMLQPFDDEWETQNFGANGATLLRNRVLYVDDMEVARDTRGALQGSQGGLYIGAGKDLEFGSFWSGLIDDVRIYDRIP